MSNAHGASRRRSYGRRSKELRGRHLPAQAVDLDGPAGWSRGDAWERPAMTGAAAQHHPSHSATAA
jgi:hypothetical protein